MLYTIKEHLAYNTWANDRMVEMLVPVSDKIFYQEQKSSFPGIARTFLHVWDSQTIWLKRMQGESLTYWPSERFTGTRDDLIKGFVNSSLELEACITTRGDDFLTYTIAYRDMKGNEQETEVLNILYHLVNHGTYHRGQIVTMLRESGVTKLLATDIIIFLRSKK